MLSNEEWVSKHFGDCDFGDKRLTIRSQKVVAAMIENPDGTINSQNSEWADTKAAYRFFSNNKSCFQSVTAVHYRNTREACKGKRCLLISDTTEINHTWHQCTKGLGMIGDGKGLGFQLHSCLAVDVQQQQIIGLAAARINYRVRVPTGETRAERAARWKESDLWSAIIEDVGKADEGTQYIHIFDRGGDNFEAYCKAGLLKHDWVVRASQMQRRVKVNGETMPLKEALDQASELGSYELSMRSRPGQKARTAKLTVSRISLDLLSPQIKSPWLMHFGTATVQQNVVMVEELTSPKGCKPVHWVLLTSLPVNHLNQAWEIIEHYEQRWLIEEYHKALKTGCKAECSAMKTADRLETEIGMTSVVAVRILSLKLIARDQPKTNAKGYVPATWIAVLLKYRPSLQATKRELTVYRFIRELAKLGGFNDRKSDGEPGWQSIWRGMHRLTWLTKGMRLAESRYG